MPPASKAETLPNSDPKPAQRSFSDSFGKAMRQSWARINPIRERQVMRKGSYGTAEGFLEYPELELLPGKSGYKDLKALEDQIDTMKLGSARSEPKPRNPSIDAANPSLSVRLTHDAHKMQCSVDGTQLEDGSDGSNSQPLQKSLPLTPIVVTGNTKERIEPPREQTSYYDCVQKHMLDEHESIKSCKTMAVTRSNSQKLGQMSYPDAANNKVKYMTWHGRPTRQPVLLQSTLDFSAELDDMLAAAKEKAVQSSTDRMQTCGDRADHFGEHL